MSNTKWRLSGAIGAPDDTAQVITQGLGFPLRPVDGVPEQDQGDIYDALPIAEGLFMQWMGPYQAGWVYPPGSVVFDAGWQMIARVYTVTKPAPVPDGNPTWALPDPPAFVEQQDLSVIYSGHTYTFLEPGWVKGIVLLETIGPGGTPDLQVPTTMTATIPIAHTTRYAELVGQVPTPAWATVEGFLQYDGVDQGGSGNTYGVDVEFEPAIVNTEWDIMSYSGG